MLHFDTDKLDLPPAGWAASTPNRELYSFSALNGSNRVDYLRSPDYIYLDGRGRWFDAPDAASDGALAIRPLGKAQLKITRISGAEPFVIRRPYKRRGACVACEAFDAEGKSLSFSDWQDNGVETRLKTQDKAVTYVLSFGPGK